MHGHSFAHASKACPCGLCDCVETSRHFLMQCPVYAGLRDQSRLQLRTCYDRIKHAWGQAGFRMQHWDLLVADEEAMWSMLMGRPPVRPLRHTWRALDSLTAVGSRTRTSWTGWLLASNKLIDRMRRRRVAYLEAPVGSLTGVWHTRGPTGWT